MGTFLLEKRRIVKKGGKFYVYSEDYKKLLGGPFDTKAEAMKRLGQIEYFKHKEGRALPWDGVETRLMPSEQVELRVKADDKGKPIIHGYAARYESMSHDLGGFVETIKPGAFDAALKKSDALALVNHDPNLILGRQSNGTLKLESDEHGLRMEIHPPDTEMARHYVEAIRRGDMKGASFAFTVDKGGDSWDPASSPPTRTVHQVRDLFDASIVSYPAYPDTSVAMRSLEAAMKPPVPSRSAAQRRRMFLSRFPHLKG